jgi:flagellar biosynthesis chaperone FliJ
MTQANLFPETESLNVEKLKQALIQLDVEISNTKSYLEEAREAVDRLGDDLQKLNIQRRNLSELLLRAEGVFND